MDNGRHWTVSVAIPSSIVDNAQTRELQAYLIGQIARALVIFRIDEIVVYDETCTPGTVDEMISNPRKQSMLQMIRILEYLECPQYLRKSLFKLQRHLQYVGLINPLESEHHYKINDVALYREGVVLDKCSKRGRSFVNVGLRSDVEIDRYLQPNIRVTVKLDDVNDSSRKAQGKVVSPSEPREKKGLYWGYSIRAANSLHDVFDECPHPGGYDLLIGTSDRGDSVDRTLKHIPNDYRHLLIVLGGLKGIEGAHECDESLSHVTDCKDLFHFYLNTCPSQGSETIRTEEALLITLAALRRRLFSR